MRICIVTPGHIAGNPRVAKEAAALAEAGHDIHVVHGRYEPFYDAHDAALARGFSTTPVPFGPRLAPRATYLRQTLMCRLAKAVVGRPLRGIGAAAAISPVASDLAVVTEQIPADLYIAHYDAALPAVRRAAQKHGALYAFDAEDFHPGDLSDEPRHAREKAIITAVERTTLPDAVYVTAASPGIADAYSARYGIARPTVLLNVFPKMHAPDAPTARGKMEVPSLCWFSQTIGRDRGLETAVAALDKATCRPHLYLRGNPSPGYAEKLTAFAHSLGVADRLHFLPPAPPEELIRLSSQYDAGLVAETGRTENHRIMLSNKQFSYMLAGLPSLMSDIPSHCSFIKEVSGAAVLFRTEDATSLAAQIDALLGVPARLAAARARAFELGQTRYNWDVEKKTLVNLVSETLQSTLPGARATTFKQRDVSS